MAKWSALEVAAEVEDWMVPPLFGKQGKNIKKLSQSMGGIVLKITDGVCRGRATSLDAARVGTRKLLERVSGEKSRKGDPCPSTLHVVVTADTASSFAAR